MIIKKKYTNVKKVEEEKQSEKQPEKHIEKQPEKQVKDDIVKVDVAKITEEKEAKEKIKEEDFEDLDENLDDKNEEVPRKRNIDDLDLTLENLTFEQRQERRDGTRRRGYRRTQDRNIISRAQDEAVTIKEAAKQEGYQEGIAKAEKDIQEIREKLVDFFNTKEVIFDRFTTCIYDIAVEMAKRIIKKEIKDDKESTLTIIKGALEEVNKTENKITLKVMPQDVEIVRDKIPEYFKENYIEAKLSVVPDNSIKEGGVVVETSNGIIDATIETQIAIMEKALTNKEDK